VVIGQEDPVSGLPNQGLTTDGDRLSFPSALARTPAGGLLVAEQGNNRVVFFDSVPATSGAAAHAAIGQPNLVASSAALTQSGLNGPAGVAVGGGSVGPPRMAVADSAANRVLVYTHLPVAGMPMPEPAVVIGQPDFTSSLIGCDRNRLNFPTAVAITPLGKLMVADALNHRVLVWNQVPTANPIPDPDLILGQSGPNRCARNNNDFNGDLPARGTLSFPVDVWSDDTRVVVADGGNNRVLIWRNFPGGNLAEADVVLGHSSFTNGAPNDGNSVPNASSLFDPEGVHSDGTALVVADSLNNRVLIWRSFPDSDFQAAEVVLGHLDFDRSVSNDANGDGAPDAPTAQVFNYPFRVLLTPDSLLVTDFGHNRVLRFAR
jgi:hypothetical protein